MSYGRLVQQVSLATMIPMILIAGPLLGYWIGSWVDRHWAANSWSSVVFPCLGFIAALKQSVSIIRRLMKESETKGSS